MKMLRSQGTMALVIQVISCAICVGVCEHVVIGREPQKETENKIITAQKFILVDKDGHERGVWETGENSVSLVFLDNKGESWVTISAVMKKNGMANIAVGPGEKDHSYVNITSFGSTAGVSVFDAWRQGAAENRPKSSLAVKKGTPLLELRDLPGKARATLSVSENTPKLELRDEKDNVSWATP